MKKVPDPADCDACAAFPQKECLKESILPLAHLKPGETGIVFQACGDPELRLRLMEMGFVRGTEVKMVKHAPLNDPLEFVIRGYHVSLRREEAESVLLSETIKAI